MGHTQIGLLQVLIQNSQRASPLLSYAEFPALGIRLGRREQLNLQLNLASLPIHGSVEYSVKSHQTLYSAVCDDSPAETTTSDLSQLTTVIILIFAMSTSLDPIIML